MNTVMITGDEKKTILDIGRKRNNIKNPSSTRRKSDIFDDVGLHYIGMIGEFAVAKFLGVDFDSTIHADGDNGIDLVYKNQTISVKYNHRKNGYLMVEHREGDDSLLGKLTDLKTDVIMLVSGNCYPPHQCECRSMDDSFVTIAGYLPRQEFINQMELRDLGLGLRYVCYQEQLLPIELFDIERFGF